MTIVMAICGLPLILQCEAGCDVRAVAEWLGRVFGCGRGGAEHTHVRDLGGPVDMAAAEAATTAARDDNANAANAKMLTTTGELYPYELDATTTRRDGDVEKRLSTFVWFLERSDAGRSSNGKGKDDVEED